MYHLCLSFSHWPWYLRQKTKYRIREFSKLERCKLKHWKPRRSSKFLPSGNDKYQKPLVAFKLPVFWLDFCSLAHWSEQIAVMSMHSIHMTRFHTLFCGGLNFQIAPRPAIKASCREAPHRHVWSWSLAQHGSSRVGKLALIHVDGCESY